MREVKERKDKREMGREAIEEMKDREREGMKTDHIEREQMKEEMTNKMTEGMLERDMKKIEK